MNKEDRKQLQEALDKIQSAKETIEEISGSEQEKFDNLSEGLQQSEKGIAFEENATTLEIVCGYLDDAISEIENLT